MVLDSAVHAPKYNDSVVMVTKGSRGARQTLATCDVENAKDNIRIDLENHISRARAQGQLILPEPVAKQILSEYGIPIPRSVVAVDQEQTVSAFESLREPVVVKVVSPDLVHKSDAGGVKINLTTKEAVRDATEAIAAAVGDAGYKTNGFLIEEMAPQGHEMVVGGIVDPRFGRLIMVGLGGIFIEVLEDVAFRICPITEIDARSMVRELRGAPLLAGARGGLVASEESLIEVLLKLGGEDGLFLNLPDEVSEVDINPLIVSDRTTIAVDARFVLSGRENHD